AAISGLAWFLANLINPFFSQVSPPSTLHFTLSIRQSPLVCCSVNVRNPDTSLLANHRPSACTVSPKASPVLVLNRIATPPVSLSISMPVVSKCARPVGLMGGTWFGNRWMTALNSASPPCTNTVLYLLVVQNCGCNI